MQSVAEIFLVNIHGKDGRGGVKHGGDRTDDRAQKRGEKESFKSAARNELFHQEGKRRIVIAVGDLRIIIGIERRIGVLFCMAVRIARRGR